jgi:hypothetical protein
VQMTKWARTEFCTQFFIQGNKVALLLACDGYVP